ncbi:protein of unknown function [Acidithiobacillus ferrivorans]|uniref:Uncharacterized protein n=1 Tax=Acidithiobacillus ferrivorans TaxID=160808 RepID=A0A060UU59_9PROT|nr:hypothetical protein AFERRI_90008 [Acidithiobacillus ferrivorans]SMH66510.1 protein of unknown function [Acidithiobacillus ferrivorans]
MFRYKSAARRRIGSPDGYALSQHVHVVFIDLLFAGQGAASVIFHPLFGSTAERLGRIIFVRIGILLCAATAAQRQFAFGWPLLTALYEPCLSGLSHPPTTSLCQ